MPRPSIKDEVVDMCPEVELLLCCARTHIDAGTAERIRETLSDEIDWAYLIQTASWHGVMPLLYRSLNTICPESVPKAIFEQLWKDFLVNAQRNLILTVELLKLLELLEGNGICAIPFKGPVLASSVYGDLALRQFSDLDILVHKQDILKTKNLVASMGYQPTIKLTHAQESIYLQSVNEYHFMGPNIGLDLHWGFAPKYVSFPLNLTHLWPRLELVPLAGTSVKSIPPMDMLQTLCMHGAKHHWTRLGWICDIAELIGIHRGLDWEQLMRQTGQLRTRRMLFLGVLLAHKFLGTTIPREVQLSAQTENGVKALIKQVQFQLFSQTVGSLEEVGIPPFSFAEKEFFQLKEALFFYLKARERLRDKVRDSLHLTLVPNDRDIEIFQIPKSLSFLYFPLRVGRLVKKYSSSLFRGYFKNSWTF
jgi:hypothetical protein